MQDEAVGQQLKNKTLESENLTEAPHGQPQYLALKWTGDRKESWAA